MEQKTQNFFPSAPPKNIDVELRLEKRLSGVNSFTNSMNNVEQLIVFFKDNKHKSKKKYKEYQMITTILKSIDNFAIIATTSSSVTLPLTGFGYRHSDTDIKWYRVWVNN